MQQVEFSEGVQSIGKCAFPWCSSLEKVRIPESVTYIGEGSFEGCSALIEVTLPSKLTTINSETFWNCSRLSKISIPQNVEKIGDDAFYNCNKLEEIEVGGKIKEFGTRAFSGIGKGAFSGTKWKKEKWKNNSYTILNDVLIDVDNVKGEIKIPKNVTKLAKGIFEYYSTVKVTVPGTVKTINSRAFYASDMDQIILSEGVKKIEKDAFHGTMCGDIKIPKSVETIGNYAFAEAYDISIKVPSGVSYIGKGAFRDCYIVYIENDTCEIYDSEDTLPGIICGHKGSTAQAYAEKYGRVFLDVAAPKETKLLEVSAGEKSVELKWKKCKGIDGYVIKYVEEMKGYELDEEEVWEVAHDDYAGTRITIGNSKKISKKITNLKKNTKYYVKVCTYKGVNVNGEKIRLYSNWSNSHGICTK